jgi:hypothetical protein
MLVRLFLFGEREAHGMRNEISTFFFSVALSVNISSGSSHLHPCDTLLLKDGMSEIMGREGADDGAQEQSLR